MKHILRFSGFFVIAFLSISISYAQNLALSATATHSGGGAGVYGPQNYNDQVISTGTFGWVSTSGNPSTSSWIQYDWASAVTCSKIKVYCDNVTTRTLTGAAIQRWDAGTSTWVTLLTYSIAPTLVYEITFPTATTTKLRLTNLVTTGSQSSNPSINEIQVSLGAAYDLSPSVIVSPVNFCGDAAAPLTVRVTNNGSASMTGFNITAQMTGPLNGTYTRTAFNRTIASGASDTVIFTTGLNTLTNLGQYNFLIYLSHTQDTFRTNDTLRSTLQVIGTPSAPTFTHSTAVCGSGPLKLHVSAVPNTGTFWYSSLSSPVIGMSDTFISPPLYSSSATYYASRVRYDVNNVMGFNQGNTIYGGNGYNFMFDVKAGNTALVLDSISFYNATGVTSSSYKIFYKVGTNIGFQTNSGAWTLGMSQTGYSMNGTGEVKLPCGNIIIPAGQTMGIYLFLESTYGYSQTVSQTATADVSIVNAASIVYSGLFGALSTTSYQWTGKLYYRKLCLSGMLSTTVTMNPKPYGGDVVPDTKFQGMNNGGASYAPDIVGSQDTVSYKLNPPTGFSNANFGSAWMISAMSFTTSGGIAPGTGDTMTTMPNGSNPGTLRFVPSVAYEDSTMILRITLYNMTTGCDSIITKYIYVAPKPKADFNASSLCFGSETQFKDTTYLKAGILTYLWDFGDASNPVTSTDQYPKFTFSAPGTYTVTLTTTTALGYSSTKQKTVTINYSPVTDFSYTNVCYGGTTNFSNTSTVGGNGTMTYLWNLGNGNNSTSTNPSISYAAVGSYTVKLTTTSNGCSSTVNKIVYVFPVPDADFSGGLACSGLTMPFNNGSTIASGNLGYKWNFGDGSVLNTDKNPSHQYDNSGTYTVRLVTYSEFGCIDSVSKTITVSAKPVAGFTAPGVCAGSDVTFSNTSSVSGSTITSTSWSFGDGNTGTNSSSSFLHNYSTAGNYTAWLKITTAQGCTDSIMKTVQIGNIPVANFTTTGSVCVGSSVNFADQSTGGSSMTYLWDFGSGNTSTVSNPTFSYSSTGVKTVSLKVSTAANCSHTVNKTITVNGLPDAGFTVTRSNKDMREVTCVPNDKTLTTYRWDMGDGQVFNQVSPVYRYLSNGPFKITLTTTNNNGCQDSKQDSTTAAFNVSAGKLTTMGTTWNVYPNPFVNSTNVLVNLTKPATVTIKLLDVAGREVEVIHEGTISAGDHHFEIDSRNKLKSGAYWLVLEENGARSVQLISKQ